MIHEYIEIRNCVKCSRDKLPQVENHRYLARAVLLDTDKFSTEQVAVNIINTVSILSFPSHPIQFHSRGFRALILKRGIETPRLQDSELRHTHIRVHTRCSCHE